MKTPRNVLRFFLLLGSMPLLFAQTDSDCLQMHEPVADFSGDGLDFGRENVFVVSEVLAESPDSNSALSDEQWDEPVAELDDISEKKIYVEGLVKGGYPLLFGGNFLLYRNSGPAPFLLRFFHESITGYGLHSGTEGYDQKNTALHGEKRFELEKASVLLSASYDMGDYGLQQHSPTFFDMTHQTVRSTDSVVWQLPLHLSAGISVFGEWYARYVGIVRGASPYLSQEAESSVLSLLPEFCFGWKYKDFDVGLHARYMFEHGFIGQTDIPGVVSDRTETAHRFEAAFSSVLKFSALELSAYVAMVTGNTQGNQTVLVPFMFGLGGEWDVGRSGRQFRLSVKGGLDSQMERQSELERLYRFSFAHYLPTEKSDWFASVETDIPLAKAFAVEASIVWRTTAFKNGIWEPDYGSPLSTSALYLLLPKTRTLFNSTLGVSFSYKIITISAEWNTCWLHVPALEERTAVGVKVLLQPENERWGVSFMLREALGSGADFCPVISADVFYRVHRVIQLGIACTDFCKLVSGHTRSYASSGYEQNSGTASVFVKFFF
ncbi:MAG: hypothetical protein J1D88_07915 [Treponema sp.]|nr:hypothetical protein [Treponema sp.]